MDSLMPLPHAAVALRLTWPQTYAALLRGQLQGEQRGGRWYVSRESVAQLAESRSAPPTRRDRIAAQRTRS